MKVLLLDGYNLIYRARYSGMNKGDYSTIFNFFRGIRPLIEKFNPDIAYMILEGKPVKRLSIDPEYKSQREYHDKDNFNMQRNKIISLMKELFPINIVKHNDYECDDVIGYLADKHKNEGNVTIISSDTDFIQCIDKTVSLYNPVRKIFLEKPDYDYVLWKSLKGDPSDNIAGFKGIGSKKAEKLCKSRELLEEFLLREDNRKKLDKNLSLIRLHDLSDDCENLQNLNVYTGNRWDNLKEIFEEYGFDSISGKEKTWDKFIKTFKKLEENFHVNHK